MLAADKLLLQSNVKQRAIQLREKELNLFNDKRAPPHTDTHSPPPAWTTPSAVPRCHRRLRCLIPSSTAAASSLSLPLPPRQRPARRRRSFNAVGTQSAVLAGFAMTSFAEIDLPHNAYFATKARRRGHGLSEETVKLVHDFYVAHPSIKRSPIASDVLKLKDASGEVQLVAKLLSEVSLTDVYLDFVKQHPDVKIKERSFRYLRPPELRRMKTRHLEMCGCRRANHRAHPASLACAAPTRRPASAMRRGLDARTASRRWCVEMRLAQDALNAARAKLALQHGAAYAPPAVHPKPSFAVAAALCPDARW